MKKSILKYFCAILFILFLLVSLASASTMQYTRFSDFEYIDFPNSGADVEYYRTDTRNAEEIQNIIEKNNIRTTNSSDIVRIERYFVKTREAKINTTGKMYLRNITEQGRGFFKNESIEHSSFNAGKLTNYQDRTVDPYFRNTSSLLKFIILRNIIYDTEKSLEISTEYSYESPDHYTEIIVWDMYTCITFETYNIFKNEWKTGELYIPEGTVFMGIEHESDGLERFNQPISQTVII